MNYNTLYDKYLGVPKKQAKSYELDLGQKQGPFKQDLLFRYGDHTIHKINNNSDGTVGMEEIMRMNEALKPFQERADDVVAEDNIVDKCITIEDKLMSIDNLSDELKEFEANMNKAVELMTAEVFEIFDKSYEEFNPELMTKYKELKTAIKEQKDENANLMKQIEFLNQEIHEIYQNILKLGNRLFQLEEVCGVTRNDEEEEDNFTESDL